MSLNGKKIKIKDKEYRVVEQFIDIEQHEEVIILKRKGYQETDIEPTTIFDLGYLNPDSIKYSQELVEQKALQIESKFNSDLEIAMIDPSGLIKLETVTYIGPLLTESELCLLKFKDGTKKMSIKFFLNSCLLADEFRAQISHYSRKQSKNKSISDNYKEILDKMKNDNDRDRDKDLPPELVDIIDAFGELLQKKGRI